MTAPTSRRELAPHGTYAAYNRHKRRGEEPCDPCKIALRAYKKQRSRENRACPDRRVCECCHRSYPAKTGAHGWCNACYMRWIRAGRPEDGPPLLTKRQAQREDYAWLRQLGVSREEAAWRVGISPKTGRLWDKARQAERTAS